MKKKTKKIIIPVKKNMEPSVKIKEEIIPSEQLFPQTQIMAPVKEFDKPLVKLEEAVASWEQYQELINTLIKTSDIVVINNVKKAKKSGINKIARFFGYSVEVIRAYKEERVGPQGGKGIIWRVWVKAIAPTGRFRVAGAACSSTERKFAHLEHDVYATAETRAKKRAIEELAGMGELELFEEEDNTDPEQKPKIKYQEVNVNPDDWRPIFKTQGYPADDKMRASKKQLEMIINALKEMKIEPEYAIFKLNNRADKVVREKKLHELNKGDAFDLCCAIVRNKLRDLVEEVVPMEENN